MSKQSRQRSYPIDDVDTVSLSIWLRFSPEIEQSFLEDYWEKTVNISRAAFFLGILLHCSFGLLDYWALPITWKAAWFVRYCITLPVILATLVITYFKNLRFFLQASMFAAGTITGLGIAVMVAISQSSEPGSSGYYVGIIVVLIFINTFSRLRFYYSLGSNIIIVSGFEIAAILYQNLLESPENLILFFMDNFFLVSISIVGCVTCYSLEFYSRKDYLQRILLKREFKINSDLRALESRSEERRATLESIFDVIHSGPLQLLASIIRSARSRAIDCQDLLKMLDDLNNEIRQINYSLDQYRIEDENVFYLKGTDRVDLSLPFEELLYEVYSRTLERDLIYFRSLQIKIPDFKKVVDYNLNLKERKAACCFLEEALCNVGKHAINATKLEVTGKLENDTYTLSILDNGQGVMSSHEGQGTQQFQKLASILSGKFQREILIPKGTLCELSWPLTIANQ